MITHNTESPRGISPRGAHRSGHKPLDLSGSCHPWRAAALRRDNGFLRLPVDPISPWVTCSLRSTGVTPVQRCCWPLRHPLAVHRFPGVAGYTVSCSVDFSMGRGGLLQFLNASLSACRRDRPARASRRVSQSAAIHVAFTSEQWVRPLGLRFRGHLCVHSRYGPMTRSPSF